MRLNKYKRFFEVGTSLLRAFYLCDRVDQATPTVTMLARLLGYHVAKDFIQQIRAVSQLVISAFATSDQPCRNHQTLHKVMQGFVFAKIRTDRQKHKSASPIMNRSTSVRNPLPNKSR